MTALSIRWKLTLWYGLVVGLVLLAFSIAVYLMIRQHLLQRIDKGLSEELSDVLFEVRRAKSTNDLTEWLDRRFARHEGFDFQIRSQDGSVFFANPRLGERLLPIPRGLSTAELFNDAQLNGDASFRIVSVMAEGPQGPLTVQVARSLADFRHELGELLSVFALTVPLALVIALGGGYFLASRALAPVQRITDTANRITAERLNERIAVSNAGDELGALSQTLNGMVERLERSFQETRQFTADAAHELRTPLTIIRNETEVALRSARSADEYRHVLESTLEEVERLRRLADHLLLLCRLDAGVDARQRAPIQLNHLLDEVLGHMRLLAQERGIEIKADEIAPAVVTATAEDLRRVFYNLLDNAIKYSHSGSAIEVRAQLRGSECLISVEDTGLGIAPDHLPRIFDRFYRVDAARAESGTAAGLGLSICQSIVRAHGGTIHAESRPGAGTTFYVRLPVTAILPREVAAIHPT